MRNSCSPKTIGGLIFPLNAAITWGTTQSVSHHTVLELFARRMTVAHVLTSKMDDAPNQAAAACPVPLEDAGAERTNNSQSAAPTAEAPLEMSKNRMKKLLRMKNKKERRATQREQNRESAKRRKIENPVPGCDEVDALSIPKKDPALNSEVGTKGKNDDKLRRKLRIETVYHGMANEFSPAVGKEKPVSDVSQQNPAEKQKNCELHDETSALPIYTAELVTSQQPSDKLPKLNAKVKAVESLPNASLPPYLCIDCSFVEYQTADETDRLARQLMLAYSSNRAANCADIYRETKKADPVIEALGCGTTCGVQSSKAEVEEKVTDEDAGTAPGGYRLVISSIGSLLEAALDKHISGWRRWQCCMRRENWTEVLGNASTVVYLSADADSYICCLNNSCEHFKPSSCTKETADSTSIRKQCSEVEDGRRDTERRSHVTRASDPSIQSLPPHPNSVAIVVGGIVDRNRLKNLTLQRCQELAIPNVRKLPIDEVFKQCNIARTGSAVLTTNQVVDLMIAYRGKNSWVDAVKSAYPKRKTTTKSKSVAGS